MTDAVKDDPVKRVTEAKVLEALGKFQPGVSDLERIYMASGIDPIYGPDVNYNLDYQLLAGQPYANYLTTTGTPVGGGTGGGGIPTLPPFTYPYTPDAEDFELKVVNLPESTVDTRISPTQGGSDPADFYSPYTLYGEGALDFDFKKGEPIDWGKAQEFLNKEKEKLKDIDWTSGGIKDIAKLDPGILAQIPGISGLLSMGERGIAALQKLLPWNRKDIASNVPEDYSPIYPEMGGGKTDTGGYAGGYQQPPDIMNDPSFTGVDPELSDLSDPSGILKRALFLEQAINRQKDKNQKTTDKSSVDADELLENIDIDVVPKRIRDAQYQDMLADRAEQMDRAIEYNQKAEGLGIGGYRYGSRGAPDSAWKVSTPHLDRKFGGASAAEWGRRGTGGIRGRMLPRAGKGFGGRNPFAGEAPLPGSPDYAEYLIDSMGFDPKKFQREIEEAVARDVPFVQMDDGQGNSYLIDKQTQQVIAGPFPTGDDSVSSIPGIGSMAQGGLALLAQGDLVENFPRRSGQISGPGTERSDDIPAMLSDGEFVTNAAALRGIGQMAGAPSNDKAEQRRLGAREMYKLQRQGMKAAGVV